MDDAGDFRRQGKESTGKELSRNVFVMRENPLFEADDLLELETELWSELSET
jgi:hypothetical protein